MRIRLGELRRIVREVEEGCWNGSRPEEDYDQELVEDDAWREPSVLVPDDVKRPIERWMTAMGLAGRRKKKRSR